MKKQTPLNLRLIRQSLGLTMSQMGGYITIYSYGLGGAPIPATRINEWERGVRPVPEHVFTASAKLLLDYWSEDRHRAPEATKADVDIFYGTLLCPALGELLKLETQLSRVGLLDQRELMCRVASVRAAQLEFWETRLKVKTGYVFDPNLGPDAEV